MSDKTTGEIISSKRHEMGMTQKELAEQLNITDKAVSKWERDVALPDINTLPKLADILNVSIEEMINAKPQTISTNKSGNKLVDLVVDLALKAIPVAMGIGVVVTSIMGELSTQSGFIMSGIGLFCVGLILLKNKN